MHFGPSHPAAAVWRSPSHIMLGQLGAWQSHPALTSNHGWLCPPWKKISYTWGQKNA